MEGMASSVRLVFLSLHIASIFDKGLYIEKKKEA